MRYALINNGVVANIAEVDPDDPGGQEWLAAVEGDHDHVLPAPAFAALGDLYDAKKKTFTRPPVDEAD